MSTKPLVFRLFMDWNPKETGKNLSIAESVNQQLVRFSWPSATIPADGATPTYRFGQILAKIPIARATRDLEAHDGPRVRAAF